METVWYIELVISTPTLINYAHNNRLKEITTVISFITNKIMIINITLVILWGLENP
jgi:Tfp pilus assembly pilus retraction ATPase PilT